MSRNTIEVLIYRHDRPLDLTLVQYLSQLLCAKETY
jgi:hypothetical protein